MQKIDLKKEYKKFYSAKKVPEIIVVPKGIFLTISGKGAPGNKLYTDSLNALYNIVYSVKYKIKKKENKDFTVMNLEGLWWWDDEPFNFKKAPSRDKWNWKSMIRIPDFISVDLFEEVKLEVLEKKNLPELNNVKIEIFDEGLSAQILHNGPYSDEENSISRLDSFIEKQGFKHRGHHHEIYLNDPNRTSPENLKTIIRYPITK